MATRDRGFASISKARRKQIASQGGKAVHRAGTGHAWSPLEAAKDSAKGVAARQRKAALSAAKGLLKDHSLNPTALAALQLTDVEWIYYGGSRSNGRRIAELRARLAEVTLRDFDV